MDFKNAVIFDIANCFNLELIKIWLAASKNTSNNKFGLGFVDIIDFSESVK